MNTKPKTTQEKLEMIEQYHMELPPQDVIKAIVEEKIGYDIRYVKKVSVSIDVFRQANPDECFGNSNGVSEVRFITINGTTYEVYL